MVSEYSALLLRLASCTGAAILILLVARKPLRRCFGAPLAYHSWLIVPLVAVAALLPEDPATQLLLLPALHPVQALSAQATPPAPGQADLLLFAWAAGMLATASWFVAGHYAFLRRAGTLVAQDGLYVSAGDAGPASVGLLRPKIVVPRDFAQRYTPCEQALVLAHERTHIARRDAIVNLLAAVFQCAFWFNPLVHLGARRMRQDQELACDALVMARHPRRRRAYAEALLKSHARVPLMGAGIHCHWQSPHPTKERVMNLQQTPPGTLRRVAGRCSLALLALLVTGATVSVRAEQDATQPMYSVAMTLDVGGVQSAPRVLTRAGETFGVKAGEWRLEMSVREADAPREVWLAGKLFKDSRLVSAPILRTRIDEKATIKVGASEDPFALSMTVSSQP